VPCSAAATLDRLGSILLLCTYTTSSLIFSAHCGLRRGFNSKAPEGDVNAAARLEQTHKSTSILRALKEPSPSLEVFALAASLLRALKEPSASLDVFAVPTSLLRALTEPPASLEVFALATSLLRALTEPSASLEVFALAASLLRALKEPSASHEIFAEPSRSPHGAFVIVEALMEPSASS